MEINSSYFSFIDFSKSTKLYSSIDNSFFLGSIKQIASLVLTTDFTHKDRYPAAFDIFKTLYFSI